MQTREEPSADQPSPGARFPCPPIPEVAEPVLKISGAELAALDDYERRGIILLGLE